MKSAVKNIGILTGGGDCPGLNAVIRAIVKAAKYRYDIGVLGFRDGFFGLIKNEYIKLENETVSGILTHGGTILGTSNTANPFEYKFIKDGKETIGDVSDRTLENYLDLKLDCIICIGGDGTLHIANKLKKKGINIIGVPKTIDNDLSATDVTFGFNSAVETATEAIDKIHSTAQSHHRVMVVEVMGRYAGWIAITSGLAGGGDIILIPEIPYNIEKIIEKINQRNKAGKRFSIVVVAEGAKPKGGEIVIKKVVKDSPDPIRLGGIGNIIADAISEKTGIETRVTVLGHLQRGGTPTAYDRIIATKFGYMAITAAVQGKFGTMVSLKGEDVVLVPLNKAIEKTKNVPLDSQIINSARNIGICLGD